VKRDSPALELTLTAAALLLVMVLVMWAQAPTADCVMRPEAARQLVLTRTIDREHLASDLASAERVVRRHAVAASESGEPHSGSSRCEDTLFEAVAERHGLTADVVQDANQQRSARP
jgi:hypothetical protein